MAPTDLHLLASRFCDENELTRDICDEDALRLRLFLSSFLAWVERRRQQGRMFPDDNVLRFNLTKESDGKVPTQSR